jgi:hypothetical protein
MPKSTQIPTKTTLIKKRSVVPIPSTVQKIKNYPDKLVIFKVPASPFWWVRYYNGSTIKRSTKTENKSEAIKFAKDFYEEILIKTRLGHSNNAKAKSFILCADATIKEDEERVKRTEISEHYARTQKSLINKHIKEFYKNYEIGDISYAVLDKFKTHLYTLDLAPATIKLHFVSIKKIFNYAQRQNIIKAAPLLPTVKNEDNPRGYLKLNEYVKFRRTARALIGKVFTITRKYIEDGEEKAKNLRQVIVDQELYLMIGFMIYTFIRLTDVKQIKHKHIEIRKGDDGDYLWMPLPKSKKHTSPITSMPRATYFYRKLRQLAIEQKMKTLGISEDKVNISEDYVFSPSHENRAYAYQQIYRRFTLVREVSGLELNSNDDAIAPYSLRHTSIMYRLIYGGEINTTKIAKNARTSTDVIERFYAAQLESSDMTRELHKRKAPRKGKQSSYSINFDNTPDLNKILEETKNSTPEHLRNLKIKTDNK